VKRTRKGALATWLASMTIARALGMLALGDGQKSTAGKMTQLALS
jgi:hypothetical protein